MDTRPDQAGPPDTGRGTARPWPSRDRGRAANSWCGPGLASRPPPRGRPRLLSRELPPSPDTTSAEQPSAEATAHRAAYPISAVPVVLFGTFQQQFVRDDHFRLGNGGFGLQAQVRHPTIWLEHRHGRATSRNAVFATAHAMTEHLE